MRSLLLAAALSACNTSSSPSGEADGGAGACVAPVEGAPCTVYQTACFPGACAGYDWSCNADTHVWQKHPTLHEPCVQDASDCPWVCPGKDAGATSGPCYIDPSALPSGDCAGNACMNLSTGVPCSDPNALPPISNWRCQCASGSWSCTFEGMNKSVCPTNDL